MNTPVSQIIDAMVFAGTDLPERCVHSRASEAPRTLLSAAPLQSRWRPDTLEATNHRRLSAGPLSEGLLIREYPDPFHQSPASRDEQSSVRSSGALGHLHRDFHFDGFSDHTASASDSNEVVGDAGTATGENLPSALSVAVSQAESDLLLTRHLQDVTELSRSLIPPEFFHSQKRRSNYKRKQKMTMATEENHKAPSKNRSFGRKRLKDVLRRKKDDRRDENDESSVYSSNTKQEDSSYSSLPPDSRESRTERRQNSRRAKSEATPRSPKSDLQSSNSEDVAEVSDGGETTSTQETPVRSNVRRGSGNGSGMMDRVRTATRRLSGGYSGNENSAADGLVSVTSCRSESYYNQKAPGSTSKLPRKAPANLKLFHELAVGIKDAYELSGNLPDKPPEGEAPTDENGQPLSQEELRGREVLYEFIGNLDFLLALVDEVAVDTVTRGALKDDTKFKGIRDVIKKCNKVLEDMLVKRERKYTLLFRLVTPTSEREIARMKAWNEKVEKAVGAITDSQEGGDSMETDSETSDSTASTDTSGSGRGILNRGRQLLPAAGRVRSRRATPTPKLRNHRAGKAENSDGAVAAEDGYSAVTSPVTSGNLAMLQRSLASEKLHGPMPNGLIHPQKQQLVPVQPMQPKDELVDVIRGLRMEKMKSKEGMDTELAALKPDWRPKAEVPSAVPKLPTEYIHRHRLMRQVVSCLLDENGAGPRDTDDETLSNTIITSITSRHGDKVGNGKTTLAVAAIQTVEVRERFCDGIAWIQLGRGPLSEKDVRRLYEELYSQLILKDPENDDDSDDSSLHSQEKPEDQRSRTSNESLERSEKKSKEDEYIDHTHYRRLFQGSDLEGIKEDLGRVLSKQNVLICLDDVWRVEDAKWFIFEKPILNQSPRARGPGGREREDPTLYRILLTTRTPSLLGPGVVQEVFVRILSEHEAVKLLLSSAGRRPYGGRSSTVFNQARLIVKGCGNSPLAVRLAGSILGRSTRNWNLASPAWKALINQCKKNLDEASQLRSFVNAISRIVDLSFATIDDVFFRVAVRRCFLVFVMAFRGNDWLLSGRGIPKAVVHTLFTKVIDSEREERQSIDAGKILTTLEKMNLIQKARHGVSARKMARIHRANTEKRNGADGGEEEGWDEEDEPGIHSSQPYYVMYDSLKTVAEAMARRSSASFSPEVDQFTSFAESIEDESNLENSEEDMGSIWSAPLRFRPEQKGDDENDGSVSDAFVPLDQEVAHELVVGSLVKVGKKGGSITKAFLKMQKEVGKSRLFDDIGEYLTAFLPSHLIDSKCFAQAADLLTNSKFIATRVSSLGIIEATNRQVTDLLELRRLMSKLPGYNANQPFEPGSPRPSSAQKHPTSPLGLLASPGAPGGSSNDKDALNAAVDINTVVRDGSIQIIDEVHRVINLVPGSSDALGMATCLAAVGEGLLKARQPRDAMLRLEEAVSIYRGVLGPYHVYVAKSLTSVAKSLVKLGETRVALLKFAEAARIYEACNATLHFDSIANAQSLATLLVDVGDMEKAETLFQEVIGMKRIVYGDFSLPVAKTINNYAILMAKHGRMNHALKNYEEAKETYENFPAPQMRDPDFEIKCKYDVTLINLNIASIRSKKGDLEGAIEYYEEGVEGLRLHEAAVQGSDPEESKNTAHRHLVAALGRIGSLKLKLGDNQGALDAYTTLLQEVHDDSPASSHTEKAKAHIKCATIYRQMDDDDSRSRSIAHLRQALEMYTAIFGPDHKDTSAIASSLRQWLTEDREH